MLASHLKNWKVQIGLEIHAQITLASKLFSRSAAASFQAPNTCVSLFDIATPGTLPKLNKRAVAQALRAASALHCNINKTSFFERKHYMYQDLPLGYQITQQRKPIAECGHLEFDITDDEGNHVPRRVGIDRIQLEQDSGKSIHDAHPHLTLVDLNRAGCSLLEIVFAPTMSCDREAVAALVKMQKLLRHLKICDGNMEEGSLRCDVNISVHNPDRNISGNRVEIKNLSSMYRIGKAIAFEAKRHIDILEHGGSIARETRGFNATTEETYHMRFKETSVDYRIIPDPDIPALTLTDEDIASATQNMELPSATLQRLKDSYGLTHESIEFLIAHDGIDYFQEVCKTDAEFGDFEMIFKWMSSELLAYLNEQKVSFRQSPLPPKHFLRILQLVSSQTISAPQGKKLFEYLLSDEKYIGRDPADVVDDLNWRQTSDKDTLLPLIESIVDDPSNDKQLQKYKNGKDSFLNYFFGEIMKKTKGSANPHVTRELLTTVLENRKEMK